MLKDKSVIVIGGSSGIGFAIAEAAAKEGAIVTIVSRCKEKLEAAKASMQGTVKTAVLDVNNESSIKRFY